MVEIVRNVFELSCDGQDLAALHFKLGFGSFGLKFPKRPKIDFSANSWGHKSHQNLTCRKNGPNGLECVRTVL